jgi:hypothetical protein
MNKFSDFSKAMEQRFSAMPTWAMSLTKVVMLLGFAALTLAFFGQMVYSTVQQTIPVSAEDVRAAERRVLFEKHQAEATEAQSLTYEHTKTQREIEAANIEAHRLSLGLKARAETSGVGPLAALVELASAHLTTIAALMALYFLLPAFSVTGDHWRLALNIAAIVVLAGLYALLKNMTADISMNISYGKVLTSFSSTSVGVYLILFGSGLAGYSLRMLNRQPKASGQ